MNFANNQEKTIFKNEYGQYSMGLVRKNTNGENKYAYVPVRFRKGVELQNKTKIVINNAWLSFYKNKENNTTLYVFIEDFTIVAEGENANNILSVDETDLPF